jgi:N-acetylglucosamine-6-phosphate deacetylase
VTYNNNIKLLNKNNIQKSAGIIEGISYFDYSPIAVEIEGNHIKNIKRLQELSNKSEPYFIAPGLIDIQVNGYLSVSFSFEGANELDAGSNELSVSDCRKVTEALWKEGITSYFPTLTTNSQELLLKNFKILAGAKDDPSLMGSIAGFHLEGPYISPVDGYRGAHPKEHVRQPDWNEFMQLYKASGENILLVTVAPEVNGALEFIRKCKEKGLVISLGHHNGSAEIIKAAIDNGAGLATHLGNGCASFINRHNNPIWPQLADERLTASIICDGFHLPSEIIRVFYKVKGADNIIITSDITNFAGLPAGEYRNKKGETIIKTQEGNLRFSGQEGGLYGSATPLSKGVGHIMKVTGCSLAKAIRMVTTNPARLHNLNDRGKLEPGKRADIILFLMDDFEMKIKKTIVAGKVVYQAD